MAKPVPEYTDMESLVAAVAEAPGNVLCCIGATVRDSAGETQLSPKARKRIAMVFDGHGLIVLPEIPASQKADVYVARDGSAAALLCFAAANPAKGKNLERIRKAVG